MRHIALPVVVVVVAVAAALAGGGAADFDDADATVDTAALDADSIVAFVNGPDATDDVLVRDVGLQRRTAASIVAHVRGGDGLLGTADDHLVQSLAELDAVKYVGPATLAALDAYVHTLTPGATVIVEGVQLTAADVAAMLSLANTAAQSTLDVDVGLDARAAAAIVAGRPFADVAHLAAASYVGASALTHLRDYARAHPSSSSSSSSSPAAEVPAPFVLAWINDYRGSDVVSELDLHRDGTYAAVVDGAPEKGVFLGPRTGPFEAPLPLHLVSSTGAAFDASLTLWSGANAIVTRDGATSTLTATLPTDGEDACDSGGGHYLDDDANGDGIYCECAAGLSWIPSEGGCVR